MVTDELDRSSALEAAHAYCDLPRPLFSRLPFDYRRVPLGVRVAAVALANRITRHPDRFPAWPIEPSGDLSGRGNGQATTTLILTHDVDSRAELDLIEPFRTLERRLGVPSAWGFVPDVSWPSETLARGLSDEGSEPYWHDIGHDGRLPYRSVDGIRAEFDRVSAGAPWSQELMRTFRSGQLLMSRNLLAVVSERFSVDLSFPDTERWGPYGATAGCGTVRPFRIGGLIEIPLSLPQDVFARHAYGLDARGCLALWQDKARYIRRVGGVAVLNVHPVWTGPHQPDMWRTYRLFIEWSLGEGFEVTTPQALAARLRPALAG